MSTTYEPPEPNAALVIGPEDHLVLSFRSLTHELAAEFRAQLHRRFPAIAGRVLIVNAESMAALQADSALSAPRADSSAAPHSPPE